jgi:hypothetical protein
MESGRKSVALGGIVPDISDQHLGAAHGHGSGSGPSSMPGPSLNRLAAQATTHCLTGCAIGEGLGLIIATQLGWDTAGSIALAVVLAYIFGYALTLRPLLRSGLALGAALGVAFAADTLSITVMEIVDNAVILLIPGAMDAGLLNPLFWGALALGLGIAWIAAFPREPLAPRPRHGPRQGDGPPRRARRPRIRLNPKGRPVGALSCPLRDGYSAGISAWMVSRSTPWERR